MIILKPTRIVRENGFTLVELVIVLMIIGIISAIAIPRFVNLKHEAVIGTLKGIEGTLQSTITLYQPIAALRGVKTGNVSIDGTDISFNSGYPDGHWNNAFRHILDISTKWGFTRANSRCENYQLCGVGMRSSIPTVAGTSGGRGVIIWPEGYRIADRCFSYYYNRYDGSYPLIGIVDRGC